MDNAILFRMTLPKKPFPAERGYRAMQKINESAQRNGVSDLSLDEINAEIEASREKGTVPNSLYDEKSPVIVHKRKKPGLRRSQDEKPFYIRQSDVVVIPPEPFCG